MESLQPSGEVIGDVFLQDDLGPTIAEHAIQCQSLFNIYMNKADTVPDPTIMDDQLARFSLWASNMDVYGPPNVSLDYRLRFSPTAADIVHQLLALICDTLSSLKPIDQQPIRTPSRKRQRISVHGDSGPTKTTDDYSSDSESDVDPVESNILKVTEIIGGTITRLFRLSNAVRRSAKANRARKIEMYTGDEEANRAVEELRLYTRCYIEFRFPEAPETLRSALVEANAIRLRRLYYQHSHRRRIDLITQNPRSSPAPIAFPKVAESTPTVRFAPSPLAKPATVSKMPDPSPVPATNATTAQQTAVTVLHAKSETEVLRAKSVLVNNRLSFPPMPPTRQCPYCGVIIEFKNVLALSLWQKHVIGDLEPFICIFSQCLEACHHRHNANPLTFETSKAWSNHMQTAHGETWECRAPSHDAIVFKQEIEYRQHSIKYHGVPEAHAAALSNAAMRPVLNKVSECPFGDDFQSPDSAGPSNIFLTDALELHVAGHMKEIALLSLQKLPIDGGEDVNIDSDQSVEDNGTTRPFGTKRESMASMLDDDLLNYPDDDDDGDAADDNVEHGDEHISEGVTKLHLEDKDDHGLSELHRAVQNEDLDLIVILIQSGIDVNSKDGNGQTPLHYAVERGFIRCTDVLLGYGANPHLNDDSGISPISWAVIAGKEQVAQRLLFENADITYTDRKAALTWAARLGRTGIVERIIGRGGIVSGTQLHDAAASGQTGIVRLLLKSGDNPNRRDYDNCSAIHYAAQEGHLDIVTLLIQHGAEVNAANSHGAYPLHCAANGGHSSIVDKILQTGQVDILQPTSHGWTMLHQAAYIGHPSVARLLLGYNPDIASHQDSDGWSALHLAVLRQDLSTIRVLLDAVPRLLVDKTGSTAESWLHSSRVANRGSSRVANLAFDKSRCCRAVTGLRQAVTLGSIPLVKLLIKFGHDVNGSDSGNRTALYYAAEKSMLPMIDLLVSRGADPNILPVGRRGWTEFVRDQPTLLRLTAAGYKKPKGDDEMVKLVRQQFRLRRQRPGSYQSTASLSGGLTSREVDRPALQGTDTGPDAPSGNPILFASSAQTNEHKRKTRSGQIDDWWKRLKGKR